VNTHQSVDTVDHLALDLPFWSYKKKKKEMERPARKTFHAPKEACETANGGTGPWSASHQSAPTGRLSRLGDLGPGSFPFVEEKKAKSRG
jgi:hypothetical protein